MADDPADTFATLQPAVASLRASHAQLMHEIAAAAAAVATAKGRVSAAAQRFETQRLAAEAQGIVAAARYENGKVLPFNNAAPGIPPDQFIVGDVGDGYTPDTPPFDLDLIYKLQL